MKVSRIPVREIRNTPRIDDSPRHDRVPALDGVRGVAVLLVLIFHFHDLAGDARPYGWLSEAMTRGWIGVDLFFVLSGFLITGILLHSRGRPGYFRNFYMRRALRILPLYICVVGLFFIALPVLHAHGKDLLVRESDQRWYWLFLENWGMALQAINGGQLAHLWSIAVEEQFYLVWPLLIAIAGGRRFAAWCVAMIVVFFAVRTWLLQHGVSFPFLYFSTITRLDGLLLGSLLAASERIRSLASRFAPALVLAGVIVLGVMPTGRWAFDLMLLCSISAAALVARASYNGFSLLRWSVLRSFGKYSYAMYVFHYLVHGFFLPLQHRFPPRTTVSLSIIAGIAISYAMAWCSWRVLEQPFLKLKRYFRTRDTQGIASSA